MLQNVCSETQQNTVTETTQLTLYLMFDSHFVCSNCSLSAFVHLFSRGVKLLTALLISSCGRLSQIICNASLSLVIDLGFGLSLHPRHGSPWRSGLANPHWLVKVFSPSSELQIYVTMKTNCCFY